jgi:UDP-N-acetylglucosamine--N-acetylmuramyl-(pentapeptide) pyrophosphoryl-undecaprenol N-acetylglucosamine transferase
LGQSVLENRYITALSFDTGISRQHMAASLPLGEPKRQVAHKATASKGQHSIRLVVAGGGTGGHLFPGIAIAEELLARNTANHVCFIGSGKPIETDVLGSKGFDHEQIRIQGIKGMGLIRQLATLLKLPGSIKQSIAILKKTDPDVVLGLGGYSAGPVVLGAWLLGIPRVLHEQNVLPGITNRLLTCFANRIYVSFENTRFQRFQQKIQVTGNPVRKEFLADIATELGDKKEKEPGLHTPFTVLIIGGSQGAHSVNMAVIDALAHLKKKGRYAFIHQTGPSDEAQVQEAYAMHQITSNVKAFFDDMITQYQKADMVICRAGATTIAELTVVGKGVIFIPYPYAADDHQALNAESLVSGNAAEMIREKDLSGKLLARKIETYASSPQKLSSMALKARQLGRPHAARMIVDDMYQLIGFKDSRIQGVE